MCDNLPLHGTICSFNGSKLGLFLLCGCICCVEHGTVEPDWRAPRKERFGDEQKSSPRTSLPRWLVHSGSRRGPLPRHQGSMPQAVAPFPRCLPDWPPLLHPPLMPRAVDIERKETALPQEVRARTREVMGNHWTRSVWSLPVGKQPTYQSAESSQSSAGKRPACAMGTPSHSQESGYGCVRELG